MKTTFFDFLKMRVFENTKRRLFRSLSSSMTLRHFVPRPVALSSLRSSGRITRGHTVRFVALAQPKLLPLVATSHVPVRYTQFENLLTNNEGTPQEI